MLRATGDPIEACREILAAKKLIPFIGAGCSARFKFPAWSGLLDVIAEELAWDPAVFKLSGNYLQLAEYYVAKKGAIGDLRSKLDKLLAAPDAAIKASIAHEKFVSLDFPLIYTTNFEGVIEYLPGPGNRNRHSGKDKWKKVGRSFHRLYNLHMPRKRRSYFLPSTGEHITPGKIKKFPADQQIGVMRHWFADRFMSPDELPYDSSEGGYQWIWGAEAYAADELQNEFSGTVEDDLIDQLSDELGDINPTWSPRPDDTNLAKDYMATWLPHDIDDPYTALMMTLIQIEDAAKRRRTKSDQPLIYRLLYVNIITAMETYLGDAFAALIFKRRDLLERFVHNSTHFRTQKISLSDIFKRLPTIEADVKSLLGKTIWHRLKLVEDLYSQAFGIKLPKPSATISEGVTDRHDIVHRNGKSVDGVAGSWGVEQIKALKQDVMEYATEIEGMLKALPAPSKTPKALVPEAPDEPIEI